MYVFLRAMVNSRRRCSINIYRNFIFIDKSLSDQERYEIFCGVTLGVLFVSRISSTYVTISIDSNFA